MDVLSGFYVQSFGCKWRWTISKDLLQSTKELVTKLEMGMLCFACNKMNGRDGFSLSILSSLCLWKEAAAAAKN